MCAHSQNGYLQIWFIQHSINTKFLATSSSQFSVTDDMNENTHPGSGGKTHHRHPVGFYCQLQETQLPLHCTVISGHAFTTEQCFYKITSAFSCFFPMHNYLRFTSVTEEGCSQQIHQSIIWKKQSHIMNWRPQGKGVPQLLWRKLSTLEE